MNASIESAIASRGVVILDGGLATELEARGHDLDHPLWSARLLESQPEAIRAVHRAYLDAGAECLITASYQASFAGFAALGIPARRARALIASSVTLAAEARAELAPRHPALIAASVGPYGAFLANGSEYRGDYRVSPRALYDFHAPRWEVLAQSQADLIACETLPNLAEAEVLLKLLEQTPERRAWFSFTCRDEASISAGTPIEAVADLLNDAPQVAAVGVNCTPPGWIEALVRRLAARLDGKPIVVYPNSGERYDSRHRGWRGVADPLDFGAAARRWRDAGARLIGGCCRTGPDHVRALRRALLE